MSELPLRVVVTGGGKGIGRAIVEHFAASGAAVAFCGREQAPLDNLAASIARSGGRALARSVDVSDEHAVDCFITEVTAEFGGIDVLVNNASLTAMSGIGRATITEMSTEDWKRTLGVNLDGVFFTTRAAARVMTEAGHGGAIVNISSVHAYVPNASTPHYDAAKAAVEALTRNFALSLGPAGIRVNAIAPGPIDVGEPAPLEGDAQQLRRRLERTTILGRFGKLEEIATVVGFLASPAASYITGQTLIVDGGMLIKHPLMTQD